MGIRKIWESDGRNLCRAVKVYRDSEWNEYRVRLYIDGRLHAAADYFTDCKSDALATARAMVLPR